MPPNTNQPQDNFQNKNNTLTKVLVITAAIFGIYFLYERYWNKSVDTSSTEHIDYFKVGKDTIGTYAVSLESITKWMPAEQNTDSRREALYKYPRISSYDINSGTLLARIEPGASTIIGLAEGKLWLYSKKDSMFFALHPRTLKIDISTDSIRKHLPHLQKDYLLGNAYLDNNENQIVIQNKKRQYFFFNLNSLEISRVPKNLRPPSIYKSNHWYLLNYANMLTKELKFQGNERKNICINNDAIDKNLFFIQPYFIVGDDVDRTKHFMQLYLQHLEKKIIIEQDKLSDYKKELKKKRLSIGRRVILASKKEEILLGFMNEKKQINDFLANGNMFYKKYLLQDSLYSFFILHSESFEEFSPVQLTKIELDSNFTYIRTAFNIPLKNILANSKIAKEIDKENNSNTQMNYTFSYATIEGDKLYLVLQLRMLCIDIKKGQLVYDIRM